ncbi:MAG: protein BatD [Candidatus Omnitrophica bacterium]|nr:protein BatD [Candidatus Omnitrophota bacterium]
MRKIFGIILLILMMTWRAYAGDISVTAEVDRNQVQLGEALNLTIRVNGTQNMATPQLPAIDGFDMQGVNSSQNFSFVNGKTDSSIAFNYSLLAKKTGTLQIPAFTLDLNGKQYATTAIPVTVQNAPVVNNTATAAASTASAQPQAAMKLEDRIFVRPEIPNGEHFLNEAIPLKITLYVNDLPVRDIQKPQIEAPGFKLGDFAPTRQSQEVINGLRFDTVEFNTVVYPTRAGTLTLGPMQIAFQILTRRQANRPPGFDNSFFSDDFFNQFFNGYDSHPANAAIKPVQLNIAALPDKAPAGFKGAVGKYEFKAQVSPAAVKVGDPITLKMQVSGDGDVTAVELPVPQESVDFKVYEPQIKFENGIKRLEQVLIPKTENVKATPAFSFGYFNPATKQYETITQGPFPLTVSKSDQNSNFKMIAAAPGSGASVPIEVKDELGEDIIFLKENPGRLSPIGAELSGLDFVLVMILEIVLWAAGIFYIRYQRRLSTDSAFARKLRAPLRARQGLQKAKLLLSQAKDKEFYDVLFQTLQEYLVGKFHLPAGAMNAAEVGAALGKVKEAPAILDDIQRVWDHCEQARYASTLLSGQDRQESFERLAKIIDRLERLDP